MSLFKILPLIFQALTLVETIRQALRNGESVMDLLKERGPALIEFIEMVGKELFPGLSVDDAVQAGAQLTFDHQTNAWVQSSLNKLENAGLIVDGEYGPLTKAAIEAFQKKHGLEIDGWAGQITQAKIQEELAKKA